MARDPSPKADRVRELHQEKIARLNSEPRAQVKPAKKAVKKGKKR